MSKFNVIPKNGGDPKYSGTPTFTGTYMKPGMLEFREVASPTPIEWVAGDYVVYSRMGRTYRLYNVPQAKKQSRRTEYGGAFIYQNVQFFDDSKQLEYCPFRDLVKGDNRIHFSTQPSISTFEGVDGIARRLQACLEDMYGTGSWVVRVATAADGASQDLRNLMAEPREFTVSGVNLLEALDKVYEIWPEVGWVYTIENNKNTIIIGGAGLDANIGTYQYGKGNGLKSITRVAANVDELANRIFAYGSSRNMLPHWYNNQNIKDAESVDIQNLMIPVSEWGKTNVSGTMLPDAAKAYVEDSASILRLGLRPTTVYFDGSGDYPEIYPTIREATIKMVRDALGSSSAKYYPSTTAYTNPNERVDRVLSVPGPFDDGLAGEDGKSASVTDSVALGDMTGGSQVSPGSNTSVSLFHEDYTMTKTRLTDVTLMAFGSGSFTTQGGNGSVYLNISIQKSENGGFQEIKRQSIDLERDENNEYAFHSISCTASDVDVTIGDVIRVYFSFTVVNSNGEESLSYTYSVNPNVNFSAEWSRKKTFTISIRQIGFDIGAQADLGDGKTIAMRTGACAGRTFAIKSVQYNPSNETWNLECYRSEDESLSQWFPNTDFPVRGLENAGQSNEYPGDEFVLLDIAMPDIYIGMAEERLLEAAQELLADTATERWQYTPDIDAKYMVENSRIIRAGEYMTISDEDILDSSPTSILVDTVTINEGEAAIPTYKVTLRDRKRTTWTESTTAPSISSKPVSNATQDSIQSLSSQTADSYFTLDASGNVTLKEKYSNLWVPGWLAAGGVGSGGGGGGGGATYLNDLEDVNAPTPTVNDLLAWNGSSWVNSSNYYTKAQVDSMVSTSLTPVVADSLPTASIATMYKMYFVPSSDPQAGNMKDEYITVFDGTDYTWEQVGSTAVDLSGYLQISDVTASSVLTSGTDLGTISVHGTTTHIYGGLQIMDVEDNGTTAAGKWKAKNLNISALTEGLTIRYKLTYAGASTTTLDLNGLGAKTVYRIGSTKLTTHYGVGAYILLYYSETLNSGSWIVYSDYDANTNYYDRINSAYEIRYIFSTSAPLYRYKICGYSKDGKIIPLNITNQTSATIVDKTPVSIGIDPDKGLVYYGNTPNKTTLTASLASLYNEMPLATNATYTFNDDLPIYKDVYLKGTIGADGLFYLDTTTHKSWYVFAPNLSTDGDYDSVFTEGCYYMFVGTTYSAVNNLQLKYNNPVYRFIGGKLVLLSELNYVAGTAVRKTAGQDVLLGVTAISNALSSTAGSDTTRVEWDLQNGAWHFYGNLYADGWVAAGGVGSASSGGGSLETLADVELTSLATNDLLRYNGTKWVNVRQSSIMPTLSVVVPSTGNALTGVTYSNGTFTFTTGTFVSSVAVSQTVSSGTEIASISVNGTATKIYAPELSKNAITALIADQTTITGLYAERATKDGSGNTISAYYATKSELSTAIAGVNVLTSITTLQDNTIDFTWHNGDVVKVDLNHEHSNYVPITRTINGVDLSQNRTFYTLRTPISGTAANGILYGVNALSYNTSSTSESNDNSRIKWEPNAGGTGIGAWHIKGNVYADGWIVAGGINSGSGVSSVAYLDDIGDVTAPSPSANDVLKYNGSAWVNTPLKTINGNSILGSGNIVISGGGTYTLPTAKANELGGILVGSVITTPTIEPVSSTANRYYYVQADSNGLAFVNVPWSGGGGSLSPASSTDLGGIKIGYTQNAKNYPVELDSNNKAYVSVPWEGGSGGGGGTVTSVGLTVPTGLSVSGSPITTSGTLAVTFTSGYSIPTTAKQTNWDTAYGWGNHAEAGYAMASVLSGYVQTSRKINGVNLSADRTFYTLATSHGTSKSQGTLFGVLGITTNTDTTSNDTTEIVWDSTNSAWHVKGNLYADGWISAGGVGSGSGDGGFVSYSDSQSLSSSEKLQARTNIGVPTIVLLNSSSELPATPDANTIYMIKAAS